jgi:hypothetical protein
MKRIGILLNVLKNPHAFDGGREYTISIIEKVYLKLGVKDKLFIYSNVSYSAISDTNLLKEFKKSKNCRLIDIQGFKKEQLIETINKHDLTVVFDPEGYNSHTLHLDQLNCRKVITLHGFRQIDVPIDKTEFYLGNKLKYLFKALFIKYYKKTQIQKIQNVLVNLEERDVILTSSKHSKYVLKSLPIMTKAKVESVYLPIKIGNTETHGRDINTPSEFILLLNSDRWIKNAYRVLKAYADLLKHGKVECHFVVGGSTPYLKKKFCHSKIHHMGYIKDNQLDLLFKRCKFLIYPSLSEGFGYPPLELLKYNKPSLLSFTTSIYEITQGKFIYFNPYSISEIKARILEAIDSYEERKFWDKLCANTQEIIQKKQQKGVNHTISIIYE